MSAAAAQSAHAVPRLIGATDWAAIELIYDALLAILGVDSLSVAGGCFYFASLLTPTPLRRTEVQPHKILKNLLERDQEGHLAITDFGLRILKSLINLNAEGEERDDKFDRVFCARRGPPKDTLLPSPSAPGPTLAHSGEEGTDSRHSSER